MGKQYFLLSVLGFLLILTGFALGKGSNQEQNKPQVVSRESIAPTSSTNPAVTGVLGAESEETFTVTKVIDGDTIQIAGGKTVRYIGIDTPETSDPRRGVQCFGEEASLKNKELVEGKEAVLIKDISETDKYGRLLRYIYIDNLFVNDYLVRQGYAHASSYPPDIKYQQQFVDAQREAREQSRGLWATCNEDVEEGQDKDCGDFSTQKQAQVFFISQGGPSSDPHRLDQDKDGVACESLQ